MSSVGRATLDAAQARARLNRFLLSQVGSQFCAGDPELNVLRNKWNVPILLVTPGFVAGPVGEGSINLNSGELESHSSMESIYLAAEELMKRRHAAIKAAFLRRGKDNSCLALHAPMRIGIYRRSLMLLYTSSSEELSQCLARRCPK